MDRRFRLLPLLFLLSMLFSAAGTDEPVPYGTGSWDETTLGNHRAVIRVEKGDDIVFVSIPWRRRDPDPEKKGVVLIDGATGRRIERILPLHLSREKGEFLFAPFGVPGEYYLYYLPYISTGSKNYPKVSYRAAEYHPDSEWLKRAGIREGIIDPKKIGKFPRARVVEFQSIDTFNAFNPMEITATEDEWSVLRNRNPGHPFLLFSEDRSRPIRMDRHIPFKWVREGPFHPLITTARPGEYFTFQVGLFAWERDIEGVTLEVGDLHDASGKSVVKGYEFTCFNLEGVDWMGREFKKELSVKKGIVQPLWIGALLPATLSPGEYHTQVQVKDDQGNPESIGLTISVSGEAAAEHGDDEPAKLTRLRWLNSRLGSEDVPVKPYTDLKRKDNSISCLGREVELNPAGLPAQIRSFFQSALTRIGSDPKSILQKEIRLFIETETGESLLPQADGVQFTREKSGRIDWQSVSNYGQLRLENHAFMEFDGYLEFDLSVMAMEDCRVADIGLEIPFREDAAKYMMGLGFKGGIRPSSYDWKWDEKKNQDALWVGDVNAGLQCSWRDPNYSRPLNTNFYLLKPLHLPSSWNNNGRGYVQTRQDERCYIVRAGGGPRTMRKGEALHFVFTLLITPFKTIEAASQFKTRYYHAFKPLDEIRATGANTVNVHHAQPINPYINYPFLRPREMKAYIDEAHEKGMKVKIYYTVRELTNRAPELFTLFSLGDEVFFPGPGGGFSWLQEHLNGNYIAGWLVPDLKDAAVVTSGVSRWHNHYVEGLAWLVKNMEIDGIYIDDVAFDRHVMKRVRRVLAPRPDGGLIDLHSANQYNVRDGFASSANLYLEHFPYIDRLWFGEYFDYGSKPDYWLIEISGIPFGVMGEMLQDGGNPWRGMLYGMTSRLPWSGDPRPVWKAMDDFGITEAEMTGYWADNAPVKTDHTDILATTYKKEGKSLIALASWADGDTDCRLLIDWKALGISGKRAVLHAPEIEHFQPAAEFDPESPIPVPAGKGWLLVVEEKRSGKVIK